MVEVIVFITDSIATRAKKPDDSNSLIWGTGGGGHPSHANLKAGTIAICPTGACVIPLAIAGHPMRTKQIIYSSALCLAILSEAQAAWTDATAGLPWLEYHSPREMGTESQHLAIEEDNLGRLFIGSENLVVYDGNGWRSYTAGSGSRLRALRLGSDGRLWAGAINEIGYFTETGSGEFQFHSLLNQLPPEERQIGYIWGIGLAGRRVYFIGRQKIYGWDGARFEIWSFPGQRRLFPLRLGDETWFSHVETGLYCLTETGPELRYQPSQLPSSGIMGILRTPWGMAAASGLGFHLMGDRPRQVFAESTNRLLVEGNPSAFATLPDGTNLVGTVNRGLMIVSAEGRTLATFDSSTHPALGLIETIRTRPDGRAWVATTGGIFLLDATGRATVFNDRNGLEGGVRAADGDGRTSYACTTNGVFRLIPSEQPPAKFHKEQFPDQAYWTLRAHGDGLLLGRHGGIDLYDGKSVRSLYELRAQGVYRIVPSRHPVGSYLLSEGDTVAKLEPDAQGEFVRRPLVSVPTLAMRIAEDSSGRVWMGTVGHGALVYDPNLARTDPVLSADGSAEVQGSVCFGQDGEDLLLFAREGAWRVERGQTRTQLLLRLPGVEPTIARSLPGRTVLVAFKRIGSASATSWGQGLGRLTMAESGRTEWEELDVPELEAAGVIQNMTLTREESRDIIWLGGSEGLLRLDYDRISRVVAPPSPVVRLDGQQPGQALADSKGEFPFDGHRVEFRVFMADAARQRDWLLQTRLGSGEGNWSAPTDRRTFEFSNLSEGNYRFEARAVNAAGLASAPAVFSFRILPPWYRSNPAYASYALVLVAGVWLTIRLRERRIRRQRDALEELVQVRTAELVKANAAKDEFLAGVSHEIRNPMNGVIGIAESLPTDSLDPDSRRKFALLRACAGHLGSLLEDLLDLSKMQAGVIDIESREFDLHELVESVAAMTASESEKRHIPVEVAISPGVPRHLLGDPRRIRQILLNFVNNALKFSDRGTVEVTVWCQPANGRPEHIEVIFAVSDEGPGISTAEQVRLFRRFERGAAAQGGRIAGTGLGLALCRGYAEKMGGRVWLESEPGRGSCFHFSAPLAIAPEPAASAPESGGAVGPSGMALVVDDQEYNRVVLADLLARLGYAAECAADGPGALALAGRHDFELVFLDYDLPGMSGLELARRLRELPGASARATVFATTAFQTPAKQRECLDAGMNAFLGKPVTLERLRKAIAAARGDTAAPPPPFLGAGPGDGLDNLRLLATKKNVRLADEIAVYLAEMQAELDQLTDAAHARRARDAAHFAHRLCGRFSFIQDRELERSLRQVEEFATKERWAEVGRLLSALPAATAALRARLASAAPAAPPA